MGDAGTVVRAAAIFVVAAFAKDLISAVTDPMLDIACAEPAYATGVAVGANCRYAGDAITYFLLIIVVWLLSVLIHRGLVAGGSGGWS